VWLVIFATMTALRWMTTDVSVTKAISHFVTENLNTVNGELVRIHAYYNSGNLCMMPVAEMDDYESGKVYYTRKQMDVLVRFSSRVRASTAIDQANDAWLTFLERNAPTVSQQGRGELAPSALPPSALPPSALPPSALPLSKPG
jgi:hypothetical protein